MANFNGNWDNLNCFVKNTLSETPAMGILFYFLKLTTTTAIISVVAGDRALPESNPSIAATYTGPQNLYDWLSEGFYARRIAELLLTPSRVPPNQNRA